jgi:hypothetical protein
MAAIDNADRIRTSALAEINKQALGEEITFDVWGDLIVENGGVVICYTMVFTKDLPLMASGPVLLGQGDKPSGHQRMMNVSRIQGAYPSEEQIAETVATALRQVREACAKALAGQN